MSVVHDRTVLITGGASGIGLLMAGEFASHGAGRILLWDRDTAALHRATGWLRQRHGATRQVDATPIDITDTQALHGGVEDLTQAGIGVDILVNNAGIVVGKTFLDHDPADIERTLAVNTLAPMHLSRALLPGMLARGQGHIVNLASAAGMVSNPGMSVYCASKWALIGWSDTLRLELERAGSPVRVTTVTPYYIATGMFEGVRSPWLPLLQPEAVARRIVAAVRHDRLLLRLPALLYALPLLRGLMPARLFDRLIGDGLGIYRSMDEFKGRQP